MNIKLALTGLALTGALGLSTVAPAKADGAASTRNIFFGAAALIAGVAIESNVARKNAAANNVQGYLQDGSTVYQDGRVVDRNGQTYYPGNQGQAVSCNGQSCWVTNNGQTAYNNGSYGNGSYGNTWNRNDGRNGWNGNRH